MLIIRLGGRVVSLLPGTTISYELTNPMFAEETLVGSFSYTFTLPLDDWNRTLFDFPDVIENVATVSRIFSDCEVEDDGQVIGRNGELRFKTVKPDRVSATVSFGLSSIARSLRERKLFTFEMGGVRTFPGYEENGPYTVPGIVTHAYNTVAHYADYDYVFAPIVTLAPLVDGQPTRLPFTINPWFFNDVGLFGAPGGGYFFYSIPFAVPPAQPVASAPNYTPFPKVRYVLRQVFRELGIQTKSDCFSGELANLVLLSTTTFFGQFALSSVMPDVTVAELLLALRKAIGLFPEIGPDGMATFDLYENVLASTDYDDWSYLAAPAYDEREISDPTSTRLTYLVGEGDEFNAGVFEEPEDLPIGAPVATVADLPTALDPLAVQAPEIRLVQDEDQFYRSSIQQLFAPYSIQAVWTKTGTHFYPLVTNPDPLLDAEDADQGITATANSVQSENWLVGNYVQDALYPTLTVDPATTDPSTAVRLAFYRGLQPYLIDSSHPFASMVPKYPLVSMFNGNAQGQRVGDYSLELAGPYGTYAQLLGRWYQLMASATPVKRTVYLDAAQLAGLNVKRKKMIDGVLYLVKQVKVNLPISKGATITMIPLPRG